MSARGHARTHALKLSAGGAVLFLPRRLACCLIEVSLARETIGDCGERTLSLKSIGGPNNTNVSLILTLVSLRTYNHYPPDGHTQ